MKANPDDCLTLDPNPASGEGSPEPGTESAAPSALPSTGAGQGINGTQPGEAGKGHFFERMRSSAGTQFWAGFWTAILVLASVYAFAQFSIWRQSVTPKENTVAAAPQKEIDQKLVILLRGLTEAANSEETRRRIGIEIDARLNETYSEVYKKIPTLADYHYSLLGEYKDMYNALQGDMAKSIRETLFEQTKFDERLKTSLETIGSAFINIIYDQLSGRIQLGEAERQFLANAISLNKSAINLRIGEALSAKPALAEVIRKMSLMLSKKVVETLVTKGVLKGTSVWVSILTGTAACSPIGFVAVACGIAGGIAAWIASDKIVLTVEAYLNRTEFETEVGVMIDEHKNTAQKELKDAYAKLLQAMSTTAAGKIGELSPH